MAILSESNDAASLAYSQRESFNVALALERWARKDINIRDVEIARALLGQRLQVRLVDGSSTYQAMSKTYRDDLAQLDSFIIFQASIASPNRSLAFTKLETAYESFLTETRRMSKSIQQVSLLQVNKVVKSRTKSEFYQSAILILVILCGMSLATWISLDILRAFRRSRQILEDEQEKLGLAIEMLDLSRAMDAFQKFVLDLDLGNKSHADFSQLFMEEFKRLMPLANLTVRYFGDEYNILTSSDATMPEEFFAFVNQRFDEIMHQHLARTRLHFEAQYRANHDLLTGFLNERGINGHRLESHYQSSQYVAGIFLDVDRFHRINDSMGFQFGDQMLLEIAQRLKSLSSPSDILVRMSSDEFLIIKSAETEDEARSDALDLQSKLQFSTINDGIEFNLTFTIGLVPVRTSDFNMLDLLHKGALSLNLAQQQLRNGFAIYSSDQSQEFIESLAEEYALRQAIKLNEFELYFQPVVELTKQEVTGGEALIRWNRPGFGIIHPSEFLPRIRDLQLHVELGEWVIDHALRMIKNSRLFDNEFLLSEFKVGINVEIEQLNLSDFADNLISKLLKMVFVPKKYLSR